MEKILVSACLLGQRVRYNAELLAVTDPVQQWWEQGRLVTVCPEVAGGLSTPRAPAEQQGDGRIVTVDGRDVTDAFRRGAELAVELVRRHHIRMAVLKARSPSCGSGEVYGGQFDGQLIRGDGLTAARLKALGVAVFTEAELAAAGDYLARLEQGGA